MSAVVIDGFAVVRSIHPVAECETCWQYGHAAASTAAVMGSIGGGANEGRSAARRIWADDPGARSMDHGAVVLRAALWDGTRRGARGPR